MCQVPGGHQGDEEGGKGLAMPDKVLQILVEWGLRRAGTEGPMPRYKLTSTEEQKGRNGQPIRGT